MRILVIGATGTIGRAIVAALSTSNEIVSASLRSAAIKVDIADPASIRQMYRSVGKLNAVVCAAGQAKFAPLVQLGDADFLVNAGLEGFVRAAALEAPRKIRVNAVSPPWVTETLQALKMDPSHGLPAAVVAQAYLRSITGADTGSTLQPSP